MAVATIGKTRCVPSWSGNIIHSPPWSCSTGCCERLDKGSQIAGETGGRVSIFELKCWNVYWFTIC